ncbi:MAG TPA: deoxynucleoside kinase, partial [Candidatus Lokiarchaeia archaeon]|nr:deoxynucleoside kinase [Candidatus Lokiarchaeia archaeon]
MKGRKKQKNLVFSIEGVHGVGKTTVLDLLRQKYANDANWYFFNERKQQRDFISFGSKDPQMAFRSEVYFIQQMTNRNKEISRKVANVDGKICVMDRSALSVLVYSAALNMLQNDFQQLLDMYESVEWREDQLIYLTATPETLLKRIRHRGSLDAQRLEWNEEDLAYVNRLVEKYEQYFRRYNFDKRMTRIETTNLTA